tara:strand:+ start:1107 stop:2384 length:1278 start_codon:yes stop_codon:yes gene_type:complete
VDVNSPGTSGRTALFYAAAHVNPSIATRLGNVAGVDVNAADEDGTTPLLIAIACGNLDVVRALLRLPGLDVSDGRSDSDITPLMLAAHNNLIRVTAGEADDDELEVDLETRVAIIRALVAADRLDPNRRNTPQRRTALMHAVRHDEPPEIVRELLAARGVDVNLRDHNGFTALGTAMRLGEVALTRLLWDVEGIDRGTDDALLLAAEGGHASLTRWLLSSSDTARAELERQDGSGATALHKAASNEDLDVLRVLLEACIRVGVQVGALRDREGRTVLMTAAIDGLTTVVRELVAMLQRARVDPMYNARDSKGRTALVYASRRGHAETVLALLDARGIDPNVADPTSGRTALMYAASRGQAEAVQRLLAFREIDLGATDSKGKTAEDLAIEGRESYPNRFTEIARMLRTAAAEREVSPRSVRQRVG